MKEAGLARITGKFVFKLLVWFILINIVLGLVVIGTSVGQFEDKDEFMEIAIGVNGVLSKLIIVNIAACVIPVLFATRKIKKKYIINDDNKKKIFRNTAIVLCVMAVLMMGTHIGIKTAVYKTAWKEMDITEKEVKEELKDVEAFSKEYEVAEDEVSEVKKFFTLADIYALDGLVFLIMIGAEYFFIVKKEQKSE